MFITNEIPIIICDFTFYNMVLYNFYDLAASKLQIHTRVNALK